MRPVGRAVWGTALGACLSIAHAEDANVPEHPALSDRFFLSAGLFVPKSTTSAQVFSTARGVGTDVDLEQALGIQTQKAAPDFSARIRFAERWRLEAEYFQLDRSGNRATDRDIQWGKLSFPANTQVASQSDFSDTRISVGYSFFKTKDKELGVGFGFHVADYNASLSAAGVGTEAGTALAPLPVISAYGLFALTDRWAVGARLDEFSLSYDQYSGGVTSVGVDLLYQPFRHVGFGLAYRSLFIQLEVTKSAGTVKVDQTFQGPLFYVNASF
jgi:hypothetical protein